MRKTLTILLFGCLTTACGGETGDDGAEEAAATAVSGKSDSLAELIVFGKFQNASPKSGTFASLELIEVAKSELPAAHYEGRYVLEETRGDGAQRSEGAFNVYRYAGTDWIRFEDDERGTRATSSEKYAWSVEDDMMRLEGVDGVTFTMALSNEIPRFDCEWGVEDSEFLPFDATDPYSGTSAFLMGRVESGTMASAPGYVLDVLDGAANLEGVTREEYIASFDDELVEVYEVGWYSVSYEMVRGWRGDTEVGVIFDYGFYEVPRALISDGDIMGCNRNGECDWNTPASFPDTTQALHAEPLAVEIDFIDEAGKLTALMEQQFRVAMTNDWRGDVSGYSAQELLEETDGGGFHYFEVGDNVEWFKWYGGDNEVGAFFERGTTNLVGLVGDGEIRACLPAD